MQTYQPIQLRPSDYRINAVIDPDGNLCVIASYHRDNEIAREVGPKLHLMAHKGSEYAELAARDMRNAALDLIRDELRRLPPQMTRPL